MKLSDILEITAGSVIVSVIEHATGKIIASSVDKDSISAELRDKEVVKQYVQMINPSQRLWVGQLCVEIKN